jgi:hypothetical protein
MGIIDLLQVNPELRDYPRIVLHAMRIMFGPEALSSVGKPELYQRTKALLESGWYIKIIIQEIEDQHHIGLPSQVQFPRNMTFRNGQPNKQMTMSEVKHLVAGTKVDSYGLPLVVDRTCVQNIIGKITNSALDL